MGVKGVPSLPWTVRYKIAVGIAEAVDYLHSGTDRCIIHRDIKPSNILLTSKKSPKVNNRYRVFLIVPVRAHDPTMGLLNPSLFLIQYIGCALTF